MNRFTAACVAFAAQSTALRIHVEESENGLDLEIIPEPIKVDGFPATVAPTSLDGTFALVEAEAAADAYSWKFTGPHDSKIDCVEIGEENIECTVSGVDVLLEGHISSTGGLIASAAHEHQSVEMNCAFASVKGSECSWSFQSTYGEETMSMEFECVDDVCVE
jgi:hypothetical protein